MEVGVPSFSLMLTTLTTYHSFGVTLWEIVTMGEDPFTGVSPQAAALAVLQGKRLQVPDTCADWLKKLMQSCWMDKPGDRPSFAQAQQLFKEQLIRVLRSQKPE